MNDTAKNEIFNLEGAEPVTILQVAETIKKLLGGGVKIEFTPARPGDYKGKEVSREKAQRVLGWKATTPFEEGMVHTVAWFKEKRVGS